MSGTVFQELFTRELFQLFDETFESVRGIYLDKGTSLGETLATLPAETASMPVSPRCTTIAAHVAHVIFYLDVIERSLRGEELGRIDWEQSWLTRMVTTTEWADLQHRLTATSQSLRAVIGSLEDWDGQDTLGDCMAAIVHTAYHLGAIRMALCTLV